MIRIHTRWPVNADRNSYAYYKKFRVIGYVRVEQIDAYAKKQFMQLAWAMYVYRVGQKSNLLMLSEYLNKTEKIEGI